MRIAVVTSLYPSPARPCEGIFVERRWCGMHARGHRVEVVHPQPRALACLGGKHSEIASMPRREERAGIKVLRPRYWHWPKRARGNAARFAQVALRSLAPETEVVVCDYAWPASALAPELARTARACLICGRGSDVLEVGGEAGLAADLGANLRAAGAWCAVSDDLVVAMDRIAGRPGVGRLVPNGVDTTLFFPRSRQQARAKLGLPQEPKLVLVVGHLIARKDPLLALDVFCQGAPATAQLHYLGRGSLARALAERCAARGVQDRVHLQGECRAAELADWYAAADLVLLTSQREGRPNVMLEALASGRPVLATRVGGTSEIVRDPAMLAEPGDSADLTRKMALLLAREHDAPALSASVGHLSWEASLLALESAIWEALHRARERQ